MFKNYKKIFFIGIGGIGMSALAKYFLNKDRIIYGYDILRSDICISLEKQGSKITYCQKNLEFILDNNLFKLSIIGKGWQEIVLKLRKQKIEVNFYKKFFRTIYISELRKIDYLIYLGNDEGSMTFMDAIQLGIKTIMIPQGFQYDLKQLVTHHLKKDLSNLNEILVKILNDKKKFKKYKNNLTWETYANNHIKIWEELKKKRNL